MSSQNLFTSRTLLPSLARTANTTVTQDDGSTARVGGHFIIDCTAIVSTPSVVPTIDGFDPASGKWYNILTAAAIVATGTTILRVYPGLVPAASLTANDVLPQVWRLVMTHGNANSITYSVGANLR